MFDLFFDYFIFDRPRYTFTRNIFDMYPWRFVNKDGKLYIVLNFLGIDEKDINISVENSDDNQYPYWLIVEGKTKNDLLDSEYSVKIPFKVKKEPENIDWTLNNGLLTLEISFKELPKLEVKINKK